MHIWAKKAHNPHDKQQGRPGPVGGSSLVYTHIYTDQENRVLTTMYIVVYTRSLDRFVITKDDIFTLYLNIIYFRG